MPNGSINSKVVFALLKKVIILHMRPITIDVREPGFEIIFR